MKRLTSVVAGLIVLVAIALFPSGVAADGAPGTSVVVGSNAGRTAFQATVRTDSQGVWVEVHARRSADGVSTPPSSGGTSVSTSSTSTTTSSGASVSPTTIVRSWYDAQRGYFSQAADGTIFSLEGINIGLAGAGSGGWYATGSQQHPNSTPYAFSVNGVYQNVVWIPNSTPNVNWSTSLIIGTATASTGGTRVDPSEVALDVLNHLPLPRVQIKANPGFGLVALSSWFWVEGYDGTALGASETVSVPPEVGAEVPTTDVPADDPRRLATTFTVDVRVRPTRYEWSFGDGTTLVAQSLGKPYPAESDVKHVYEHSSLPHPNGFPLRLTVDYSVEYQVNGGAPEQLPPIRQVYEASYAVQEAQPVLTRR